VQEFVRKSYPFFVQIFVDNPSLLAFYNYEHLKKDGSKQVLALIEPGVVWLNQRLVAIANATGEIL
jgi:hypothetical protein